MRERLRRRKQNIHTWLYPNNADTPLPYGILNIVGPKSNRSRGRDHTRRYIIIYPPGIGNSLIFVNHHTYWISHPFTSNVDVSCVSALLHPIFFSMTDTLLHAFKSSSQPIWGTRRVKREYARGLEPERPGAGRHMNAESAYHSINEWNQRFPIRPDGLMSHENSSQSHIG